MRPSPTRVDDIFGVQPTHKMVQGKVALLACLNFLLEKAAILVAAAAAAAASLQSEPNFFGLQ